MAISKSEYLSGLGKFKAKQDAYNESIFAKKGDIVGGLAYKGTVAGVALLPESGNNVGDMYNISVAGGTDAHGTPIKAGDNVIWNGTGWDNLGGEVDLSGKVDKVQGKQLSTEDYTTAEKEKLAAIAAGAQVNVIESISVDSVAQTITNKGVNIDLSGKVDKVQGKQLSTEDYTSTEKTKLAGIDEGAEVNEIEIVKVDNQSLTITNKTVNIDLSGKVDKVQGKQLSTEDYTTSDQTKLAGIAAGAQVNVIETVKVDGTSLSVTDKAVDIDLSGKVDKVTGKGLSTNDFTDALKTKLEGITEETITQADIDALFASGEGE